MYHNIIFDIDGTLLQTEKVILSSLKKVLEEELGKVFEEDDLDFVLGIPGEDTLKRFGIVDVDRVMKKWDQYQQENQGEKKVFPEIEDVLRVLAEKGVNTGIVTSKTKTEFENDFNTFDLSKYFKYIITADDTEKHKPDPDPLLKYAEMAQADLETIIYVGDTVYDLTCAERAGIDFALALWGTRDPDEVRARIKLRSPKELLSLVFLEPSP